MPAEKDGIAMLRVSHSGGWLRVSASFAPGSASTVLVTVHLKA
jgi:hypothetical protein